MDIKISENGKTGLINALIDCANGQYSDERLFLLMIYIDDAELVSDRTKVSEAYINTSFSKTQKKLEKRETKQNIINILDEANKQGKLGLDLQTITPFELKLPPKYSDEQIKVMPPGYKLAQIFASLADVTVDNLKSSSRERNIVVPRQCFILVAHHLLDLTTSQLGKMLGGRDHTTIVYAHNQAPIDIISEENSKGEQFKRLITEFARHAGLNEEQENHLMQRVKPTNPRARDQSGVKPYKDIYGPIDIDAVLQSVRAEAIPA